MKFDWGKLFGGAVSSVKVRAGMALVHGCGAWRIWILFTRAALPFTAHPRQLMAFLGLVPSERSTGETVKRGGSNACRQPPRTTRPRGRCPGAIAIRPG